jgi:SSS family solute:Na+ symporter
VLLVPYIIIAVMGGGTTLSAVSGGVMPFWLGGAIVSAVVMGYVFFGGMRGTAWVNALQTIMFLAFGSVALMVIAASMGGFREAIEAMLADPAQAPLLTRERVSPLYFFSYTFIPLSSIAFPHIGIFCLTARRLGHFRRTIVLYPICMLAIWLPSVFLGVMANQAASSVPAISQKLDARAALAASGPALAPDQRTQLQAAATGDDVILHLVRTHAPIWLAALLSASVMAAVMASDSQILALSTMCTEDVFAYYGGRRRFGERLQVMTGRMFVIVLTLLAYGIAVTLPASIFSVATQYAFAGYAALAPLLIAALFWKGSTKWGALAATLWTAAAVAGVAITQTLVPPPARGSVVLLAAGGLDLVTRGPSGLLVLGLLPVVPMTIISGMLMIGASLATRRSRPAAATLSRYFAGRA